MKSSSSPFASKFSRKPILDGEKEICQRTKPFVHTLPELNVGLMAERVEKPEGVIIIHHRDALTKWVVTISGIA